MQKYFIWQGKTPEIFFESSDTLRSLWSQAFHYPGPAGHNHVRTGFIKQFSPMTNFFAPVASVMAGSLNEVFDIGNGMGDESQLVKILPEVMHSVSIGDIIQEEDGECHLVMPMGFLRLGRVMLDQPEVYYA